MERLRKEGAALVCRCAKQRNEPTSDKRGAKVYELHLKPPELIERIAALVPPPGTHRRRYFGALAPKSPLRYAVTALAQGAAVPHRSITGCTSGQIGQLTGMGPHSHHRTTRLISGSIGDWHNRRF